MTMTKINGEWMTIEQLDSELRGLFADALFFPNSMLPESWHGKKEWQLVGEDSTKQFGRSGTDLLKQFQRDHAERIERERHAVERARRVESYRQQVEESGEFDYDEFVVDAISAGRPNGDLSLDIV